MALDLDITREIDGDRGRYVTRHDGKEAELTFRVVAGDVWSADHVGVPRPIEGRGVGRALVARLVEDARAEGFRIVPRCPFVDVLRRRRRDWSDVFAV